MKRYKTLTITPWVYRVTVTGNYFRQSKGKVKLDIKKIAADLVKEIIANGGLEIRGPLASPSLDVYEYGITISAGTKRPGLEGID